MSPSTAILAALVLPLAGALGIALLGAWPNLRESVTLATATILFAVVCALLPPVLGGGRPEVNLLPLVPGLLVGFKVEPLGMLFALVASGLWIVTSIYSIGYMRGHHEQHQTRFYVCFAVAIAAALGVAFARNVITLFIFYEVLTLSTYPLVTHYGDEQAKRAGRVYLGILLGTSVGFLLLAVIWTWELAGTLEFTPGGVLAGKANDTTVTVLLALYAFGTGKAALMPFHRWLPAAMVAPTPVSALLHAVAVVKAGVFTVMKVAIYIFGIELLHTSGTSVWLMYVAGATVLGASLVAMTKDNLKERLAYSTISQLSYIVLGVALADRWGVLGGGMHIAMHAFGKITLFFCAGAIMVGAHKTRVSELDGLGRTMPFTMAAFAVGALSVIGLPPMGGAWSKWYLALGTVEAGQLPLLAVLMISSLLNIAYLMPIPARAFFLRARDQGPGISDQEPGIDVTNPDPCPPAVDRWEIREAPVLCVVPLCVTAAGCVALFFFAGRIYELLGPIAGL
jgi:multicomponent Na+:H+ antiporter subunit D